MLIKLANAWNFETKKPAELEIPEIMRAKIKKHWESFITKKKNYWDGDAFITNKIDISNTTIEVAKTKFSALIYARENTDLTIRSLFASILFKTKDDKYIIIKNYHNKYNIIGGIADSKDFIDNKFSPEMCIKREVMEETGLDLDDDNQVLEYQMKYLDIPNNNENYYEVGVIYTADLNFTSSEFSEYVQKKEIDNEISKFYFYTEQECLNSKKLLEDTSYVIDVIHSEEKNLRN